jgi:hypothetical protein
VSGCRCLPAPALIVNSNDNRDPKIISGYSQPCSGILGTWLTSTR